MQKPRKLNLLNNLRHALDYAERGWAVFPIHYPIDGHCSCRKPKCSIAKHPMTTKGFKDATKNTKIINSWWLNNPKANIGVPTGQINRIVVIDIDPRNRGHESLIKLRKLVPELTKTLTHITGGKGYHFIFSYPNDVGAIKVVELAGFPGIDVKADGGYVVVPPSLHVLGNCYSVVEGEFSTPQPLPQKLLELLQQAPLRNTERAKEIPDIIPEGQRNNTLASIAGSMNRRGMSFETIVEALKSENQKRCNPPLSDREVFGIAESICRYPKLEGDQHRTITIEEWTDPEPLRQNLSPVPTVDLDYLPELLREWVKDISARMQCPIEYPIATAFAAFSSAVGKKVCIQPKRNDHGFIVVPNLWGGIIGQPGQKKTPAMDEALSPLKALNDVYAQLYKIQLAEYQEASGLPSKGGPSLKFLLDRATPYVSKLYKGKKPDELVADAIFQDFKKRQEESQHPTSSTESEAAAQETEFSNEQNLEEPNRRQLIINDVTMEKLGEILAVNPYGILVFRDELAGFFAQLSAANNKRERPFYLEGWPGLNSYTFDRIGRGQTHIPHLAISIFGSTQPDVIAHYISETMEQIGNDGFLQRFQTMFYPNEVIVDKYSDEIPNDEVARKVTDAIFDLATKTPEEMGALSRLQSYGMGMRTIHYLQFDDEAQKLYQKWNVHISKRVNKMEGQSLLAQHLNKYHKLMPALALLCHLLESVDSNRYGPVSLKAVQMAEYWCNVLEQHAIRIYDLKAQSSGVFQAGILLEKIKEGKLPNPFTVRDVTQKNWTGLAGRDAVEQACKVLEQHSYIRAHHVYSTARGGRPTVRYEINPKILKPKKP